jgi:hypothetical protein
MHLDVLLEDIVAGVVAGFAGPVVLIEHDPRRPVVAPADVELDTVRRPASPTARTATRIAVDANRLPRMSTPSPLDRPILGRARYRRCNLADAASLY